MKHISIHDFQNVLKENDKNIAYLDVRSAIEHKQIRISEVRNIPMDELKKNINELKDFSAVYVHCATGNRSQKAVETLRFHGIEAVNVRGGIQAWEQAGFEVEKSSSGIPLMRQVLITAGSLIVISILLSMFVHESWKYVSLFVGSGLLFAGLTGWCGMAMLLSKMPWNKTEEQKICAAMGVCKPSADYDYDSRSLINYIHKGLGYEVIQFEDAGLSHYSYALISEKKIALIDPARNPQPYYDYAEKHHAEIVAIFETHPHADFVSSHLEIAGKTGAKIFTSKLVGARYEYETFDDGDTMSLGNVNLSALNTPGHSADSISILLKNNDTEEILFSGDTLFVGDVGRPDLRENVGNIQSKRKELAGMMFDTVHNVLASLSPEVIVFPAHGSGSLCGKSLGSDSFTTIAAEKENNLAFLEKDKNTFVERLTTGQPFIPQYFIYDVEMNREGATAFQESVAGITHVDVLPRESLVIDTRPAKDFRKGHILGAINIPDGLRFETWLGALISPKEKFYIIVENERMKEIIIEKIAKIGYESHIQGVYIGNIGENTATMISDTELQENISQYTIIDVRDDNEVENDTYFDGALHIPLHKLREERVSISTQKPVVVYCAGGYRSGIAQSILLPYFETLSLKR